MRLPKDLPRPLPQDNPLQPPPQPLIAPLPAISGQCLTIILTIWPRTRHQRAVHRGLIDVRHAPPGEEEEAPEYWGGGGTLHQTER